VSRSWEYLRPILLTSEGFWNVSQNMEIACQDGPWLNRWILYNLCSLLHRSRIDSTKNVAHSLVLFQLCLDFFKCWNHDRWENLATSDFVSFNCLHWLALFSASAERSLHVRFQSESSLSFSTISYSWTGTGLIKSLSQSQWKNNEIIGNTLHRSRMFFFPMNRDFDWHFHRVWFW